VVTARSLSPGEQGSLDVTFDTTSRGGDQEKTVRIFTNDPENETVVLTIMAQVISPVAVEPTVARIGDLGPGDDRTVKLKLLVEDPATVRIRQVRTSSPQVTARITDQPDDGEGELEVRMLAGGRPYGKFEETVIVRTTSDTLPRLEIPVVGQMLGDIRLEPQAIGFQANTSPIEVRVSSAGHRPFRITGIEDASGRLETSVVEEADGTAYTIRVGITSGSRPAVRGEFRGSLQIRTDRQDQPILELPVHQGNRSGTKMTGTRPISQNPS